MRLDDIEFTPLRAEHTFGGFSCGNIDIDRFLKSDQAYAEQFRGLSSTTLILHRGIVIGFYTARCTQIEIQMDERTGLDMDYDKYVPAVEITFLAVDTNYQREGLGTLILSNIIGECIELTKWVAVKYLFLWSVPESIDFYERNHFVETDIGETRNQIAMRLSIPYFQTLEN
ncbi:GNAT family N-acetyltransferase [Paenibacillus sp. GXUN7292]|uniref:GNAT family N-acetyltransferase n=1 Tax=Paenibacillus sp. GXUN7292 TaxID=3422499 RepID=UPI003D7CC248